MGFCLFRILHAQPESAFEHEIQVSFGIMFKTILPGGRIFISALLVTSYIFPCYTGPVKCKVGPWLTHPQASHPGKELTCTASVVLLGSSPKPL